MGYLYVLSNRAMPGLLKIGRTESSVLGRVDQLSAHTGVPFPFTVEHSVEVWDSEYAERDVHQVLHRYRVNHSREFFSVSLADVVAAIEIAKRVDGRREAGFPGFVDKPKEVIAAMRRMAA